MLTLLADENFNRDIVRRLLQRVPELNLIRVQSVGLHATDDRLILEWAAEQKMILLTHDRNTMTGFAFDRVRAGLPMPGIVVVSDTMSLSQAVNELELLILCSEAKEFENQVKYIPL